MLCATLRGAVVSYARARKLNALCAGEVWSKVNGEEIDWCSLSLWLSCSSRRPHPHAVLVASCLSFHKQLLLFVTGA